MTTTESAITEAASEKKQGRPRTLTDSELAIGRVAAGAGATTRSIHDGWYRIRAFEILTQPEEQGRFKWLVDPETDRLLGCGIVGAGAGELIAEAVLAIEMECVVGDVVGSIHPHPTLSETLAFAGEVYMGTATEVYRPKRTRDKKPKD